MKRPSSQENPSWLTIAQEVQQGLSKEESITFYLSITEISEVIKKVAEDLIQQEGHLIPRLKYRVPQPELSIVKNILDVVCKIEILKPTRVDLNFSYSYVNSKQNLGKLELRDLKISMKIKSRIKGPIRKLVKRMNIGKKANAILSDIETVLLDLFPKEANINGTRLSSLNLTICNSDIKVIAIGSNS